ncbi:uncharacterized protein LOC125070244 [Vanessa atalanta]|uniref:uncharacterized protein LOC125070244 n=1 Tax=Vanessa atalanta TaxID=42275 RepID=UPI001FCDA90A|nr:uncharacterized protein LOC125070244 [Vanessa atalanta]
MIGFYTILFLGCIGAVVGDAPPYVQSAEAFVYAKTFVSEKLPIRKMDIHRTSDRPHLSFAMLTGVTGGLVLLKNDSRHIKTPLEVVDEYVPLVWNAYNAVSQRAQSILNDANHKVALIVNLINSICGSVNVEECNAEVQRTINDSPYIYQRSADLLLSLGKVSVVIRDNESTINSIIGNDNDIPYLIHNVETKPFLAFIELIKSVYADLNELSYRRFLSDS